VPLVLEGSGVGSFAFAPDVILSPSGDQIGTFAGTAQLINKLTVRATNGEPKHRARVGTIDAPMAVKPSIILTRLRTIDAQCQDVTPATNPGHNLALGLRASDGAGNDRRSADPLRLLRLEAGGHAVRAERLVLGLAGDGHRGHRGLAAEGQVTMSVDVTSGDGNRLRAEEQRAGGQDHPRVVIQGRVHRGDGELGELGLA